MQTFPVLLLLAVVQTSAGRAKSRSLLPPPTPSQNIVLVLADDMGVDLVNVYGEAPNPPCTPNLDQLAAGGLLFRNAWASPVCSATRAQVLTGRHGFRTGVGDVLTPMNPGLALTEVTIPEVLSGYASAALGKWHLHGNLGLFHPLDSGFDRYAGAIAGQVPDYFAWTKTIDGVSASSSVYATTDTADEAIFSAQTLTEPWFLYVNFNAPHVPLHTPPSSLCPSSSCTTSYCATNPPSPTVPDGTKALVEALDTEFGRMLSALRVIDPEVMVFFMGDNGTSAMASQSPFLGSHAKDTLYEGGVNVPFIVQGPGVATGECAALVSATDLHKTIAELAGRVSSAEDSVSLVPYFANPAHASIRASVYAETFQPIGGPPFTSHVRAVRNERFKLIRETGAADELYDLQVDPFEASDLYPPTPGSLAETNYDTLVAELVALGVD